MRLCRSLGLLSIFGFLVAPTAVLAQTVTTSPFDHAPTIGLPILVFMAAVLAALSILRLRRISSGMKAGLFGLCACVMAAAAYAGATVTVQGADCNKRTTFPYNSNIFTRLKSECPNDIAIVQLDPECEESPVGGLETEEETLQDCFVGLILHSNDRCRLPQCNPT